jgi:hypothetical protein
MLIECVLATMPPKVDGKLGSIDDVPRNLRFVRDVCEERSSSVRVF